jgi:crotonobetainyl-CoA:carnitine CoA-transferase CaiB-like acyl-CoA transferase
VLTASYAAIGILAALRERDASGRGQHIDLGLLDVQVSAMINVAQAYLAAGVVAQRNGNEHPSVVPSQSFDCQDGMIMLAAGNDGQFAKLCEVIGRPELARDPRFATNAARVRNRDALTALVQKALATQRVAHWTERLSAAGVPCGPVNDIAQVFADPHLQHRGARVEMEHPLAGTLPLLASPLRLSQTPVEYRLPPPLLGEHTEAVLSRLLGLSAVEIAELRRASVL